ncbi:M12 family metallopeptidase [Flavitalea antarctica]
MKENSKEQDALKKIAEIAKAALQNGHATDDTAGGGGMSGNVASEEIGCSIKQLPERLLRRAAETAMRINPTNAPVFEMMSAMSSEIVSDPQFLTLLVSKYWGPAPRRLAVSFMQATSANLKNRILTHMNAWTRTAGISFYQTTGTGHVRISTGPGGYWSYLGTDILLIPSNQATMNLQGFTMNTPESEFIRVIRHETGHTLGFPHEHMRQELVNRIDPQKAYDYFWRTQGWNQAMVNQQVLTPLSNMSIFGTPADQTSIMCYQLPGSITRDGRPITGGVDINATDYAFAGRIYPKPPSFQPGSGSAEGPSASEQWPETEDVSEKDIERVAQETVAESNGH